MSNLKCVFMFLLSGIEDAGYNKRFVCFWCMFEGETTQDSLGASALFSGVSLTKIYFAHRMFSKVWILLAALLEANCACSFV